MMNEYLFVAGGVALLYGCCFAVITEVYRAFFGLQLRGGSKAVKFSYILIIVTLALFFLKRFNLIAAFPS
jgi:hypothetical protein